MIHPADLLYGAAAEIDKGWCHCIEDQQGNVCAVGALHRVAFGDARHYGSHFGHPNAPAFEAAEVVLTRVMQKYFDSGEDIRRMNDSYATSGQEISHCMRKAATEIRLGDIGDNPHEIEVIPATRPVREAPPEPAPAPTREPEKVPA